MFIKNLSFRVEFSSHAEKYFCKEFLKKYKPKQWVETRKTILETLERFFAFQQTALIDNLKFSQEDGIGIFKLDFRVAGTNESPKLSGNRVIFSLSNVSGRVEVLLVYGKIHCSKNQSETQWVLEQVKGAFPEYKQSRF